MVVEPSPASAFVMAEADLLLELLIVPLDAPSKLGAFDEVGERGVFRQGREPIFGRLVLPLRPLDQEPFFWPRRRAPVITMRWPDTHGREARAERRICPLAPSDSVPSARRQGLRQRLGRERLLLGGAAGGGGRASAGAPFLGRQRPPPRG